METKEKNREKTAPARREKGPAPSSRQRKAPAGKRPEGRRQSAPAGARPPAPEGEYEVYVPDAQSQQVRHGAANEEVIPVSKPQRAAKPPKKASARGQDAPYRPYREANQRNKARKKQNFREGVSKFFSYQNPVVKRFYKEDPNVFGEDARIARKQMRLAEAEKKRRRAEQLKTPAVIYTQPMSFNSRRLAVQLTTILAVVLALVLGMSVFFRVKNISVLGANVYSDWTIREKSGINEGDNLLTFGRTKASGQIIANLPYVKSARIGIKLPDTVIIEVEEEAVVYSIQDQNGVWWLMNSDGKVVEQTNSQTAHSHTLVLGVTLYQPQPSELGVAAEAAPTEADPSGEAVPAMVTGAQRLNAALKILQALELNDIVGDAASVDVSQLQDIILQYGTQYQVNLGSINNSKHDIVYKITYMKNAILQMSDYQTGVLDVSFTTWPDQIGFTPFG